MRFFWFTVGLISTACGLAGAVLPVLPTTPFLILAAFAFSRSSPGFHHWLVTHPRLGPPLEHWRLHGAIARRAKILAATAMVGSMALSLLIGVQGWLLAVQAVVLAGAAAFVLSRPDLPQ